ncbi:MAG: hypothetical protein RLZZ436_2582 [Planctomycetota bacterium]|jgi:hypothetical protein
MGIKMTDENPSAVSSTSDQTPAADGETKDDPRIGRAGC